MSSRVGFIVISLIIAGLVTALVQIAPNDEGKVGADSQTEYLAAPQLSSTEALAKWHGNPQESAETDSHEKLTLMWNSFRGKFSPLPNFGELPATFRVRTLAAGHGKSTDFTIAMCSEWDAETIAEKLRPFRERLNTLAAHRVDIDRLENGVLVETHETKASSNIYVLRHASWLIVTNTEANIPILAKAAVEQQQTDKEEITLATYSKLNEILTALGVDGDKESQSE